MGELYGIRQESLTAPPLLPEASAALAQQSAEPLRIEPSLAPRDEAALLLTAAAEIEHALMTQYLYAAWSVRLDATDNEILGIARRLHQGIVQIAREEMGHLMTVQNLLQLIGASLNLRREHSPFESELYPFRFKLERLSLGSLSKYVTAERPAEKPDNLDQAKWDRLIEIANVAKRANDGRDIQHVGPIFERLIDLFQNHLSEEDFHTNEFGTQATWDDWGYDESLDEGDDARRVLVRTLEGTNPESLRTMALEALKEIADQGEGYGTEVDSHFERFLGFYDDLQLLLSRNARAIWPVVTNPHTLPEQAIPSCRVDPSTAVRAAFHNCGCISDERSKNWAHLFDLRYRQLLGFLWHFLSITGPRYVADGPDRGDRTPRGFLLLWSFDEMRRLRKIGLKLMQMSAGNVHGDHAGPPFRLPYSLTLPNDEPSRWRSHLDVVNASMQLLSSLREDPTDGDDPFLADLVESDNRARDILSSLISGNTLPEDAHHTDFQKAANILEEAVRGFTIEAHGNFWTGMNRETFVNLHMFNQAFLARDRHDSCRLVSDGSFLMGQLLSSRKTGMPRYRPKIDPSRIAFLRNWIDAQAPDNTPPNQVGVKHERHPATEPDSPSFAGDELLFDEHIRPMFRPIDQESYPGPSKVDFAKEGSVRKEAAEILAAIQSGTFPIDASWRQDQIDQFVTWAGISDEE